MENWNSYKQDLILEEKILSELKQLERIDEMSIQQIAKKIGVPVAKVMLMAKLLSPAMASAGVFNRSSDTSKQATQQVSEPWWKSMTTQDDGSLAAVQEQPTVTGTMEVIVYADAKGNPPIRVDNTVDGPVYVYESGQGVSKLFYGPNGGSYPSDGDLTKIEVRAPDAN